MHPASLRHLIESGSVATSMELHTITGVFAQSRNKSRIYVHVKACITEVSGVVARCGERSGRTSRTACSP